MQDQSQSAAELRRQAEAVVGAAGGALGAKLSDDSALRLLHELQVHHVELELQDAELRLARDEVEVALEKFTDLYDFAPVGYLTLARDGTIRSVNLTGAVLLGLERSLVLRRRLDGFLPAANRLAFSRFLGEVFASRSKTTCEMTLDTGRLPPMQVLITAIATGNGEDCRAAIFDISERRELEAVVARAYTDLELRVQERTAALVEANAKLQGEIENRNRLEETLRDSQLRLRNLSAALQSLREEERKAIAREIHDELGQVLASVQMGVSLLAEQYLDHRNLVTKVKEMEGLIEGAIKSVQRISSELRPVMLDVLGLADAMDWQGQEFQRRTGISCQVNVLLLEKSVHPDIAIALYRILQESLTNVQRHSGATQVKVLLLQRPQRYSLTIQDNGRGISREEASSPSSIGLIGLRERVFLLGGRIRICGVPKQGTALLVRVPVPSQGVMA